MTYVAVVAGDSLFTWGDNVFGQLGLNSKAKFVDVPTLVLAPVKQVSCSKGEKYVHTSCIDD